MLTVMTTLDDLQATWKAYEARLVANQQLQEQLVRGLIKDRSRGVLAKMKRELALVAAICGGLVLFFGAALVGNPFDFTHWLAYVPLALYLLLALVALGIVLPEYHRLQQVELIRDNLREGLLTVLHARQRLNAVLVNVWRVSMLLGFTIGLSLTARKIETYAMSKLLLMVGVQLLVVVALYAVATWVFKSGKDPIIVDLQENLRELDELQQA